MYTQRNLLGLLNVKATCHCLLGETLWLEWTEFDRLPIAH